jgi:hypothetical protein
LGDPIAGNTNCLEQGTDNRNKIYISRESKIYRTDNGLITSGPATWTSIWPGLPDLFMTGIAINPANANEVYVCFAGFDSGEKVYMSNSGGSPGSWVNLSGSLPNVCVNTIVFDDDGNNGLYIGTDIGVFYKDDFLADWIYFSNSMPSVIVNDLFINTTSNKIVAGTYGRGLWHANLYSGCDDFLLLGSAGTQLGGNRYYSILDYIVSIQEYSPDLGTTIHYAAGNYIDLQPGFEISNLGFFEGKIGPCPGTYSEPLMTPESDSQFVFTQEDLSKLNQIK